MFLFIFSSHKPDVREHRNPPGRSPAANTIRHRSLCTRNRPDTLNRSHRLPTRLSPAPDSVSSAAQIHDAPTCGVITIPLSSGHLIEKHALFVCRHLC
jgi:hypothetical protein